MDTYTKEPGKAEVLKMLRKKGFRITRQREILIDIILNENCTCCKEIYYLAAKRLPEIGIATIYRMVSTLEEIGAINKGACYQINSNVKGEIFNTCTVAFENGAVIKIDKEKFYTALESGLKQCKYVDDSKIKGISLEK